MGDIPTATTEGDAEAGCVTLTSSGIAEQPLSDAVAWREDGVYIVRSTEFDMSAEDERFQDALDLFAHRTFEYAAMLAELAQKDEATEEERRVLSLISERVFPFMEAVERREERRRWLIPRRRLQRTGHWRHRGTQAKSSSQLSRA